MLYNPSLTTRRSTLQVLRLREELGMVVPREAQQYVAFMQAKADEAAFRAQEFVANSQLDFGWTGDCDETRWVTIKQPAHRVLVTCGL